LNNCCFITLLGVSRHRQIQIRYAADNMGHKRHKRSFIDFSTYHKVADLDLPWVVNSAALTIDPIVTRAATATAAAAAATAASTTAATTAAAATAATTTDATAAAAATAATTTDATAAAAAAAATTTDATATAATAAATTTDATATAAATAATTTDATATAAAAATGTTTTDIDIDTDTDTDDMFQQYQNEYEHVVSDEIESPNMECEDVDFNTELWQSLDNVCELDSKITIINLKEEFKMALSRQEHYKDKLLVLW
jgi:hypothetical protein